MTYHSLTIYDAHLSCPGVPAVEPLGPSNKGAGTRQRAVILSASRVRTAIPRCATLQEGDSPTRQLTLRSSYALAAAPSESRHQYSPPDTCSVAFADTSLMPWTLPLVFP